MSDLELRSQLYAWLGDRTSKVDGDAHDHESLLAASRDLARLPELAALIADAERVRELEATVARVRDLADQYTGRAAGQVPKSAGARTYSGFAKRLRRALDGDR